MYGYIYLVRNNINNKCYIGQTIYSFKERYHGDISVYTHNKHLKNAIKKYGIKNFFIDEEFDIAFSKEELDKLESMYINIFNTTLGKYGYNKKNGGSNGKPNEETKEKFRQAKLGKKNYNYRKPRTEETKTKIGNANRGKKIPKERIEQIRKFMLGKYTGDKSPRSKKIVCLNTNKIYATITEAGKDNNISSSAICLVLKKKHNSCGNNLVFRYYDEFIKMSKEEIKLDINKANVTQWENATISKYKKVFCVTTGETFNSIKEASEATKTNKICIGRVCKGTQKNTVSKDGIFYEFRYI